MAVYRIQKDGKGYSVRETEGSEVLEYHSTSGWEIVQKLSPKFRKGIDTLVLENMNYPEEKFFELIAKERKKERGLLL